MGGGGGSVPQPVAVPSAADEEAAEERARLYSMLRRRRAGSPFVSTRRRSLLSPEKPKAPAPETPWVYTLGNEGGTGADTGGRGPGGGPDAAGRTGSDIGGDGRGYS